MDSTIHLSKINRSELASLFAGEGPDPVSSRSSPSNSLRMVCLSARALEAASGALEVGGGDRNRTRDLLLAKQTLYQLSYAPSHVPRVRLPHKESGVAHENGGPRWTRTTDLTLIRRTL